jgi:hypothetical protein
MHWVEVATRTGVPDEVGAAQVLDDDRRGLVADREIGEPGADGSAGGRAHARLLEQLVVAGAETIRGRPEGDTSVNST